MVRSIRRQARLAACLIILSLVGCSGQQVWEYNVVSIETTCPSVLGTDALMPAHIPLDAQTLNTLGGAGWELCTSFLEMETAFPNFGSADYHTGIKSNTRPSRLVMVFRRPILRSQMGKGDTQAQKLFDKGSYEEILTKYPNLPIAKQAKDKVAEKLLAEGKYDEILAKYADTPSAADATNKIAEKLIAEKKFDEVIAKYPNTPAANAVRNALADQLYAERKIDHLIAMYPDTPAGMKARNDFANTAFDKIMKKPKKARQKDLEAFVRNPKFAGTSASAKAQEELNKLSIGR